MLTSAHHGAFLRPSRSHTRPSRFTVCELINRLLKDPNWRVRHASLSMLPFLAFILKTPDKFAEALPALQWGAVLGD